MSQPTDNDENDPDLIEIKTVLIGESGVGKTSIIKQFVHHEFDQEISSSLSGLYSSKKMVYKSINKNIKFDIWDTAVQEIYRSLAKIFYKDAKVIIFVYDITNKKTFDEIKKYWYKQIKANSIQNAILAVVGNKYDLYDSQDVNDDKVQEYADSIGAIFQLTSAKSNYGIKTLFKNIGKKYFDPDFDYKLSEDIEKQIFNNKKDDYKRKTREGSYDDFGLSIDSVKLNNEVKEEKKRRYCC